MPSSLRRRPFAKLALMEFESRLNPAPIPVLNSLPGAPADIYMDFDGDASSGNTPYDTDGNAADYSTSEVADITRAWEQLSGYFAMFNVNVTTVFTSATPKAWLVLSNSVSGGYSYVNVFPNSSSESFNQSSDVRSRVSGLAHEVGHNFGNSHQSDFNTLGVETADYISAKEPLRGYLMGVDFSGTVKKWSIGHTSNASSLQDDLATIASDLDNYGGDGYRLDDIGNTVATATAMTVNGAVQSGSGIIERMTDLDYFSFASNGGRVAVTVAPRVPSGLDARLEIRDAANTLIAVADTVANGQTITLTLPAGTFYAVISSKGNYADLGQYDVTVKEGAPEGWQTTNVGLMWYTGSTAYTAATDTWNVTGSGTDIWGTSDQFQYAWQYLSGDGTITARVTGMQNTNANAKAGVMIRESLGANSRHVSAFMQWNAAPQLVFRSATGGSSSSAASGSAGFTPTWVRLTRAGNVITAFRSTNGTTWTQMGTPQTVGFTGNFYVGLAVTSHEANETNTTDDLQDATLTNVTVTGFSDPLAVTNAALPAPTNLAAAIGIGNAINLTWDAVAGATGYRVEQSSDNVTFLPAGTTTTATTLTTSPLGSQRYWYRVRATDAAGRSDVSAPVTIVNAPSAVRNLELTSYTNTSIVLDWFDTDGETAFRIERSADSGATWTTLTNTLGKNIPSYTATGLTAGTAYTFRVTPLSAVGDGAAVTVGGLTRLPAVTTTLGAVADTTVVLNWTDIAGETGFRIDRSTDGTTWTSAGTVAAGVTTFTATGLTASTEYYFRVAGTATGTESVTGNTVMAGTTSATALPTPWSSTDIGITATAQKGSTSFSGGTFRVISAGGDIWNTSDNFRFTYQALTGNGVITARVASVENTGGWVKAGVMIRESLAANARHAHTFVTPSNGVNTQSRTSVGGGSASNFQATGVTAPEWVRMRRVGNVLSGFYSADGVTWTAAGTVTLSGLATTIFIGLSSNANTTSLLNLTTFDNVSVFTNDVNAVTVNDGGAQRSAVTSLTVAFNGLVTLPANPANAFTVTLTGGGTQAFTVDLSGSTATRTIAKLNFTGGTVQDGAYTLAVLATQVTDASGFGLGTMPATRTTAFHRLFGDSDGNRTVDGTDLTAFGNVFNTATAAYDINLDGIVDGTDLTAFGNRFGVTV